MSTYPEPVIWVDPIELRAWEAKKAGEIWAWPENVEGGCVPLFAAPQPLVLLLDIIAHVKKYDVKEGDERRLYTQAQIETAIRLASPPALEANQQVIETLRAEIERLLALIRWAHETLYEINPSNYDHNEVCKLNDASVEVILGLAPTLGETHGQTAEWWAFRAARSGDAS
jgi:hypothetical protein